MTISQEIKDLVKVKLEKGFSHTTRVTGAAVRITKDDRDSDGTVQVEIDGQWVEAEDCLELSVFFKKLAKKLGAA